MTSYITSFRSTAGADDHRRLFYNNRNDFCAIDTAIKWACTIS